MTHGTSGGAYTWCGDPLALAKGWATDKEEVECLDCLRAEVTRLEGLILDWEGDPPGSAKAIMREAKRIRGEK